MVASRGLNMADLVNDLPPNNQREETKAGATTAKRQEDSNGIFNFILLPPPSSHKNKISIKLLQVFQQLPTLLLLLTTLL